MTVQVVGARKPTWCSAPVEGFIQIKTAA